MILYLIYILVIIIIGDYITTQCTRMHIPSIATGCQPINVPIISIIFELAAKMTLNTPNCDTIIGKVIIIILLQESFLGLHWIHNDLH